MDTGRKLVIGIVVLASVIVAMFLNFGLIEHTIISDSCYYHTHDTNWFFNLFYYFPSFENGHPFPTWFNFILTLAVGVGVGLFAGCKLVGKKPPPAE